MNLAQVVSEGNTDRVRELLAQEPDLDQRWQNGMTPLIVAAVRGHADMARMLVEAGAQLDLQDDDYQTALMHAICQQHEGVVELLLEAGASVDVENWLALDFAVRFGKPSLVKRFLDLGADPNRRDEEDEMTPLLDAVSRGNVEMVRLLLDAGADPTITAEEGQTALSVAAQHGNLELFELLHQAGSPLGPALLPAVSGGHTQIVRRLLDLGVDVNATHDDEFAYSPLSWAAERGHAEILRLLVAAGADLERRDWMGQTPLWSAAGDGHTEVARILLEAGADANVREKSGDSLLQHVTWMEHADVVDLLLDAGADPNAFTKDSPAALIWASSKSLVTIARRLLDAGADPNVRLPKTKQTGLFEGCPHGTTPLMLAAREGDLSLVALLLDAGADPKAVDSKGRSAAEYATKAGQTAVLERLRAAGAEVNLKSEKLHGAALLKATESGDLEAVRALKAGAQVEVLRGKGQCTPLVIAAREGHTEIVRELLDAGADPNKKAKWDYWPLRVAVVRGHAEVVRHLLRAGADPNITYPAGSVPSGERNTVIPSQESPLMDAASGGHEEILELLLESGANVNLASTAGYGPLLAAVDGRQYKIARRLIELGATARPEDADYLAVLDWENAAGASAFRTSVTEVTELCGAEPEPVDWLPGSVSFRFSVAETCEDETSPADATEKMLAWSKQWDKDRRELAGQVESVLGRAARRIADRGYLLIDAGLPLGCGPMKQFLVLLPTPDKYAVLAAFGVSGNDAELSNRELIAWLRDLDQVEPFTLRGCKFDAVEVEFAQPVQDPEVWAQKMQEFCPDLVDRDELDRLVEHLRTSRRVRFWWD